MTAIAKWRKAPVRFKDGQGPIGYHRGNLATYPYRGRDDGPIVCWSILHQPSGLGAGQARTLCGAKTIIEAMLARFPAEEFDRLADGSTSVRARDVVLECRRIVRQYEKV